MATVAQSLFGVTPESLMAAREQRLQEQALQFAQLSPMQAAQAGFFTAGSRLGTGIGGLLGAEDPELMRVRQRQQLLQGVNPTDPASLRAAAQKAMEANDFPAAQELASRAVAAETSLAKLESERALTAQRLRERQAASLPEKVFAALAAKATPASVKAAQDAGNDVSLLQIPENVKVSTYGQVLKDAGFVEGTPEFQAKMREFAAAELEATKKGKGTKVDVLLPGQQVKPKDWGDFVDRLDKNPLFKQSASIISAAPSALETIRMSTSNDIAAVAIGPQLARMAGESGALSAQDVNRWAKAGGLDDRLIGSAVSFFTGRLTQTKKAEAEKYVSAVFRGALLEQKRLLEDNAEEFGYDESPNYKKRIKNIESQLDRFKKPSEVKPPVDSVVRKPPQPQPTGNPLIDKYLINP